ncbi:MAG TPA: DUF4956 domain-containing protein, partial [Pyrinomonadaceae bacterium]
MRRTNQQKTLIVGVLAALVGFVLVALFMSGGRRNSPAPPNAPAAEQAAETTAPTAPAQSSAQEEAPAATTAAPNNRTAQQAPATSRPQGEGNSVIETLFGADDVNADSALQREHWTILVPRILMRLALAALLVAVLAFRPRRRGVSVLQRNPYVAQTQILLAVVASALMMIVGDSAARAFGIFAAASLVRFRTNIRDPKEITVLLISLAIGLATGVGRWDLALTLAVFVFPLLWVLEHYAYNQVMRSM